MNSYWNSFGPPDSWYEPDCYPEYECSGCDNKEKQLETAKEFLESVIQKLYSQNTLDVHELERDLDELCCALDVKLLPGELQIQRKKQPKTIVSSFNPIEEWKTFNQKYLEQLAQ